MTRAGGAAELFDFLESRRVCYAVLGDTRGLPAQVKSDIDLLIDPAGTGGLASLVRAFCTASGFRLVQCLQHEISAWYFVLARRRDDGEVEYLATDFCGDYYRGGRCLLHAGPLLAAREPARDEAGAGRFHVCASRHAFLYYLLKRVDKGEIGPCQAAWLSSQWRADPEGAARSLREFGFPPRYVAAIRHAAELGDWGPAHLDIDALRRCLRSLRPRTPGAIWRDGRRRLARVLEPAGFCVALLGPDGTGKSTLIEHLSVDLGPAFRHVSRFHLRPRLVHTRVQAPVDAPHAVRPRGTLFSLMKLAGFAVDYVVGHAVRVRPRLARSHCVLFDRHARDLAIDPVRYRIGEGVAAPLSRWLAAVVPAPQLWLVLDAQPEVIRARKAELPVVTTATLRRRYLDFASGREDAVMIDANPDERRVAAQATDAVLDRLARRTGQRLAKEGRAPRNPAGARVLLFFCRHRVPVLSRLVRIVFNSDIYCRPPADLLLPHPYGIVVHSATRIGRGVTLMQQVTLGGKEPERESAPILEDAVYVGAGARILGNVRVGAGAVIGANAVVTRHVPAGGRVVGANRLLRDA